MKDTSINIRIGGEGGEGVISCGEILTKVSARAGYEVISYKTFPAEIKGGLAQYQLRIGTEQLYSQGSVEDVFLSFYQDSFDVSIPFLRPGGYLLFDPQTQDISKLPADRKAFPVPLNQLAKDVVGNLRAKNIIALGALCGALGFDKELAIRFVHEKFGKKGSKVVDVNLKGLEAGYNHAAGNIHAPELHLPPPQQKKDTIVISGNDAVAIGAIAAGCRFMAGYPITPASSILEFLAGELPKFGGVVHQAEDEIAALGACLGASYAGVKSMTATSGPGIALMTEMIILASMTEVPVVIVDVQRSGPSTGMPTKTEQSDLKYAIYGTPGEGPKIVIAPSSVEDCFYQTIRAFNLAEKYQMPVIVLSDQTLSVRTQTIPRPRLDNTIIAHREVPKAPLDGPYKRYLDTPTGISPMAIPGVPDFMYTASGLEHDEIGHPKYTPYWHHKMNSKRFRKLTTTSDEIHLWKTAIQDVPGAKIGIIGWGSTEGAIIEARKMAAEDGILVSHIHPRIVTPLPERAVGKFLNQFEYLIIVEENFTGQFSHFLKAKFGIKPIELLKCTGMPMFPGEIYNCIKEVNRYANTICVK